MVQFRVRGMDIGVDDATGVTGGDRVPVAGDTAALTASDVMAAFRRMDQEVLPAVLTTISDGKASTEVATVIGDAEAVRAFLAKPDNEGRARKAEMGRTVWRRLGDVLDGRVREEDVGLGLSDAHLMSLRSLVDAASEGRPFRMLRFPLHPGEVTWLHALSDRLGRLGIPKAPAPQKAEFPQQAAPTTGDHELRERPIPRGWFGTMVVTKVCQKAGVNLRKGQANEVTRSMGTGWKPRSYGEVLDAVSHIVAHVAREDAAAGAVSGYLKRVHGIPPSVSRPTVTALVRGRPWTAVTDVAVIAELVEPHLHGMLQTVALRNGRAAFDAHVDAHRFSYFPDDVSDPAVVALLRAGDIAAVLAMLSRMRTGRISRVVSDGMGTLDLAAISALAEAGDGRPAVLVRSLMPVLGATLPTAAKAVASALGATKPEAAAFAAAAATGEKVVKKRETDALRRKMDWEASLISVSDAREALGATPTEFRRWMDDGLIPVAMKVPFRKWGSELVTTRHDPVEIERIKAEVPAWRAGHVKALAQARKEAAQRASRTRAAERQPDPPEVIRGRRLAALIKSAGLDGTPAPGAIRFRMAVPVWDDLKWSALMEMAVPPEVEAAIQPERRPAAGKARKLALEALQEAARQSSEPLADGLAAVVAAWRERAETVAGGFPAGGADAFLDRLRREVSAVCEDAAGKPGSEMPLQARLSALLERALVAAVNIHARDWGVEDLRIRSGLADYAAMFPEARAKRRRFILHLGPTNSGKTHGAMDLLAAAGSGTYLAPLRLMALEGAERMNGERGTPTSMVTGEEIHLVEGARHVSATIEMADLASDIEVAVVDEVQMIADRDRGWAWTQALVGIPADTVVMTGSVDALPYVTRIAQMTGDELEVVMFERMTPLDALSKPVALGSVRDGDAIVAFSRAEVLRLRDEIASKGIEVATVYGALGPEVRRAQAARFRSGAAKVLIATDAIAMGLNLPIRRVLLSALQKFDGTSVRPLTAPEIRQIAGRAGRYGLAERGEVGVTPDCDPGIVRAALAAVPRQPRDDRVPVMPPWPAVEAVSEALLTDDLSRILLHVTGTLLKGSPDLRAPALDDALSVARAVATSGLPLRHRFRYLGCPIETRAPGFLEMLTRWARAHGEGGSVAFPSSRVNGVPDEDRGLADCEQAVKLLSAYLWLAMRYPSTYVDQQGAARERDRLNGLIDAALRKRSLGRSCRRCGARLRRSHRFPICDDCFGGRNRYD